MYLKKYYVLALLIFPSIILSQEIETDTITQKTIQLNEVLVTGNAKNDPILTIIKDDYTEKVVQPKNTGELFQDINGFSLIKRGNYAVDPSFRASQYEQLNIQFDGGTKAMHACPNRMDPITTLINPEEVTKIEIIKGPFSVRYGATFGGIINMVTNNACTCEKKLMGTFSSGFESNGNSLVNLVQLMSHLKKFDITANMSHRNYGNYEDGANREIPSSFRSLGYGLKIGYNFSENQRLQVSFRQNFGRDVLHAGLMMDTDIDDSTIGSVDYSYKTNNKKFKGITAKAYFSFVDHTMSNYNRPSFTISEAISVLEAVTKGGKVETQWDLSSKIKIFTGLDATFVSRDGGRNRVVKRNMMGLLLPVPQKFTDKVWQNSSNNTMGIFAETKYYLSDKEIVTVGLRTDFVTSKSQDLDTSYKALYPNLSTENETNLSGNISYKKIFSNAYSLEIAFGRGARSANIEERFIAYFNIGKDAYEYIGNPFLKAEINNQLEISWKGKETLKGFFNELKYGLSGYYSIYENYIMGVVDTTLTRKYNPTTPPVHPKVFRNVDDAFKTGFEVYADLNFAKNLTFTTECSYVYTENKDFNESLPLTPPFSTRLKLGYELEKFWLNFQGNLVAHQNKISKSFDETTSNSYETLDFKAGFKPLDGLNIGFGLLNIFDRNYNIHQSYSFNNQAGFTRTPITEPGRNGTIFVSYTF